MAKESKLKKPQFLGESFEIPPKKPEKNKPKPNEKDKDNK